MHHACKRFTQKHGATIPLSEDFLFASTTTLNCKFNFQNLMFFYLDIKNQMPTPPPLHCNYRSNAIEGPARNSESVWLIARNLVLLMMSVQQTWWTSLTEFSSSLMKDEECVGSFIFWMLPASSKKCWLFLLFLTEKRHNYLEPFDTRCIHN